MNPFDEVVIDEVSFAYRNIIGQDKWTAWAPIFGILTTVGTPAYVGRYRFVGKLCQFQVTFSAGTSVASVAGTDYLNLPVKAMGLTGFAVMTNDTSNVAVGLCHIDVTTGRCYLPTQTASGNVFHLCGAFEI